MYFLKSPNYVVDMWEDAKQRYLIILYNSSCRSESLVQAVNGNFFESRLFNGQLFADLKSCSQIVWARSNRDVISAFGFENVVCFIHTHRRCFLYVYVKDKLYGRVHTAYDDTGNLLAGGIHIRKLFCNDLRTKKVIWESNSCLIDSYMLNRYQTVVVGENDLLCNVSFSFFYLF